MSDVDVTLGPRREPLLREILEPGPARSAALDVLAADLRKLTDTCTDRARPHAIRLLDRAVQAAKEALAP